MLILNIMSMKNEKSEYKKKVVKKEKLDNEKEDNLEDYNSKENILSNEIKEEHTTLETIENKNVEVNKKETMNELKTNQNEKIDLFTALENNLVNIDQNIEIKNEKNIVLLKLINKMLKNMNKAEIDELIKFVDINRECISTDLNYNIIKEMEKELFPLFNKKESRYYVKEKKSPALNILRGLTKQVENHELCVKQKCKVETVNDRKCTRIQMSYSIIFKDV